MSESIYLTAFIVGVLGGVHCLGMCGGVVGGLTFGLEVRHQKSWWRMLPFQLFYNFGRITSYVLLGVLFGLLGMALGPLDAILPIQQVLQILAGVLMIALGLYLAGWWFGITVIEKAGGKLWRYFKPYASQLTPINNFRQAGLYGLFWGWLPCGLVYSTLILALSTANALEGGLVMLAFGLGTLPNLLLMGVFAFYFTRLARNIWIRRFAGSTVIFMGIWYLQLALS